MTAQPGIDTDLYSDSAIRDPFPVYRAIRDLGPLVWLSAHDMWAVGRHVDVRQALLADSVLLSGHGVAANSFVNAEPARVTLTTDGDLHRRLRSVVMKPMTRSGLRDVHDEVRRLAETLIDELTSREHFDGVVDFARLLPVSIVSRLVGLPDDGRERMLDWAAAIFDALGPANDRGMAAFPLAMEMAAFAAGMDRARLNPDGWAARLFGAADAGLVEHGDVPGMLIDYIAPSLDTTILASGHLLFELGSHPEQWELLRSTPGLVAGAVDETLRMHAPVRAFTRFASEDVAFGDATLAAGQRVLVIFGSANRDERRYADPDRFDITRDAKDHVGFGYGSHRCAGAFLAELEMESLLLAMIPRVKAIEVGEPKVLHNNVLHGYESFPASFRT
ncbi:MAG TPA: cytochrome P450 [Candidatus Limnocylindrales bacterium]|nr:cytochrome P450 [Candidatus Limnocylindrales bacterium]